MDMDRKKIKNAVGIMLSLFLLAAISLLPVSQLTPRAEAQLTGEVSYGGNQLFWIPCTCSENTLHFIFDYKTLQPLALVYQPGASMIYLLYNIFGTYLLGTYQPGAGECLMYAGYTCFSLPSDGMMGNRPGTGTSL